MFEFTTWHSSFADFFIKLWHYTVIGKQLFILNDRNRVRWVVLGLLQDGACTDLVKNISVKSLEGDLSNATTFNPPLFSLSIPLKGSLLMLWYLYSWIISGASLSVWLEKFRGSQKKTSVGLLEYYSFLFLTLELKFRKKCSPIWNVKNSFCQKKYRGLHDRFLDSYL